MSITQVHGGSGQDPLSQLGYKASEGAVPGYVPDKACATCHPVIYKTYQHVGMAQSFSKASEVSVIEDFGKEFFHAPSDRYYQIRQEGQELIFKRYLKDADGKPIHEFEREIAWVMGSGNRARSYLYQNESGELFMLPLGWYTEGREWGMSPGFEHQKHLGVLRQVKRQCMFCHNAYPEVEEGNDTHWMPHQFPKELPQGTGCQRCHGPGAEHIRTVLRGSSREEIHAKIINPRKLPPEQRDSVCFQCHMLPSVTMIGVRRFGRDDYSFRPGQSLSDYMVHAEVESTDDSPAEGFEINHHGYRLWQSRCYQKSQGELTCISCHNPHVKPDSKTFRAKVSNVCRDCHEDLTAKHPGGEAASQDCASCHMPTRRTRDVVLVTMTDHQIARGPFDLKELVQPIEKKVPMITGLEILPFGEVPKGDEATIYKAITTLKAWDYEPAREALQTSLNRSGNKELAAHAALARSQVKMKKFAAAEKTAKFLLKQDAKYPPAYFWLGYSQLGLGQYNDAIVSLKQAVALNPVPEYHYNLSVAAYANKDYSLALKHADESIRLRSNLYKAWMYKGRANAALGSLQAARSAFIRSLEIDPANESAYVYLVRLLRKMGKDKEAARFLKVGLRVARTTQTLKEL